MVMQERQRDDLWRSCLIRIASRVEDGGGLLSLPGLMGHRVARTDGEVVGLVGVVLRIGVEGDDPDLLLGGQVVDLNRLAGKGIGAAVERDERSMERSQFAEGLDIRPRCGCFRRGR